MLRDCSTVSIHILSTGGMSIYILNTIFHFFILIHSKKYLKHNPGEEKETVLVHPCMHFFAVPLKQKKKKSKILIYWIKGPFLNYCMLESESTMLGLGPIMNHPSPPGPHSVLRRTRGIWASGLLIGRRKGRFISFHW